MVNTGWKGEVEVREEGSMVSLQVVGGDTICNSSSSKCQNTVRLHNTDLFFPHLIRNHGGFTHTSQTKSSTTHETPPAPIRLHGAAVTRCSPVEGAPPAPVWSSYWPQGSSVRQKTPEYSNPPNHTDAPHVAAASLLAAAAGVGEICSPLFFFLSFYSSPELL